MLLNGKGTGRNGTLGWGLPDFVTEHLNPIAHIKTTMNVIRHPIDTVKGETAKAAGNVLRVAAPWVGGSGYTANEASAAVAAAANPAAAAGAMPECGFFQRLGRLFGANPPCV